MGLAEFNEKPRRANGALIYACRVAAILGSSRNPLQMLLSMILLRWPCSQNMTRCIAAAGAPQACSYLPNSLTRFPSAEPLKRIMQEAGYHNVRYRLLGLGTMAIHVGEV